MDAFAINLKQAIVANNWSLSEFARRANITKGQASKYTHGIHAPPVSKLSQIADVVGLQPEDLVRVSRSTWEKRRLSYAHTVPPQIKNAVKSKTFQPHVLDEAGNPKIAGTITVAGKDYPRYETKKIEPRIPEGYMYPIISVPIDNLLWKLIEKKKGDVGGTPEWREFHYMLMEDFEKVGIRYPGDCEMMIVSHNVQIYPSNEEAFIKLRPKE